MPPSGCAATRGCFRCARQWSPCGAPHTGEAPEGDRSNSAKTKTMKVLLTGAAGFIGSHLARALLQAGHSVRAIDDLSTGQFWRIEEILDRIEWMEADICDPAAARAGVQGVDGVLHQAAIPSVSRSLHDPVA